MKYVKLYAAASLLTILSAYTVYFFFPHMAYYVYEEDCLAENLSALFFLSSFFVGLLLTLKLGKISKFMLLTSFIGLLGFLDEISFGERFFNLSMPYIDYVKIDAVHDIFYVLFAAIKYAVKLERVRIIFLSLALLSFLAVLLLLHKEDLLKTAGLIYSTPQFSIIFVSMLFIGVSLLIDVVETGVFLSITEEIFEMNAAIGLLFTNICTYDYVKQKQL